MDANSNVVIREQWTKQQFRPLIVVVIEAPRKQKKSTRMPEIMTLPIFQLLIYKMFQRVVSRGPVPVCPEVKCDIICKISSRHVQTSPDDLSFKPYCNFKMPPDRYTLIQSGWLPLLDICN